MCGSTTRRVDVDATVPGVTGLSGLVLSRNMHDLHVRMYTHTVYTHTHTHVRMYIHTHTHTYTYICTYVPLIHKSDFFYS